jgi:hypothetical protein
MERQPPTSSQNKNVNSDHKVAKVQTDFKIATYNCKNIQTSAIAVKDLVTRKDASFILIQEHWLYDNHLQMLEEVYEDLTGVGKAIDSDDPITPAQMPRGFGGVAILWKKDLDQNVRSLNDGGTRVQAIEITTVNSKLVLVSVYMPSKGLSDQYEEFVDTLEQLHEIIEKYQQTHNIVIGGDFNEDISGSIVSRRQRFLQNFKDEHSLTAVLPGITFVHANGRDTSAIDFFLQTGREKLLSQDEIICDLPANTSDHYPVLISVNDGIQSAPETTDEHKTTSRRTPWRKIDLDLYRALLDGCIESTAFKTDSAVDVDKAVMDLNNLLREAANSSIEGTIAVRKRRKAGLQVWNESIADAMRASKQCLWDWKQNGRPNELNNPFILAKKDAKHELCRQIRVAVALKKLSDRQDIMDARECDINRLYKLIDKHRGKLGACISELRVGDRLFQGSDLASGWKQHFVGLAEPVDHPTYNNAYAEQVTLDVDLIAEICEADKSPVVFSALQVREAISSLNKNKAEDAFGLAAEHLVNAGDRTVETITSIINAIMYSGKVPACLKEGIITPVFKNKGNKFDAKNYRGITVTPVIMKILEALVSTVIKPLLNELQHPMQRGFTANSSPLMCASIIEEVLRESQDNKLTTYTAYLDAKSAFDVVNHNSLVRKLYLCGIEGKVWSVIRDIHTNARSAVKWNGSLSEPFNIEQGVRQGGLLSTDLYKVYVNDLLYRLEETGVGARIGAVQCVSPTCADDITVLTHDQESLQTLLDTAVEYSQRERYILQPTKSAVLVVPPNQRNVTTCDEAFNIGPDPINIQSRVTHLGMERDIKSTAGATVEKNIQKAHRRVYSLMKPGLHGENGLDPVTCLHLARVYVLPILLYALEICLPTGQHLIRLEIYLKKVLKQILSLPVNTADTAIYILTGILPVEAQIEKKALIHLGALCRLPHGSAERRIAYRQLCVKPRNTNSWFAAVRIICVKYNIPDPLDLLRNPKSKFAWKRLVNSKVDNYWKEQIIDRAQAYSSLKHLNTNAFQPGTHHPILNTAKGNPRDVTRLLTRLKLATGTYILQTNRKAFNQNKVSSECMLCKEGEETKQHFIFLCKSLEKVRRPILETVYRLVAECGYVSDDNLLQLVIDSTGLNRDQGQRQTFEAIDFHARRLCYQLHVQRYKLLETVDAVRRKRKKRKRR